MHLIKYDTRVLRTTASVILPPSLQYGAVRCYFPHLFLSRPSEILKYDGFSEIHFLQHRNYHVPILRWVVKQHYKNHLNTLVRHVCEGSAAKSHIASCTSQVFCCN